MEEIKLQQQYDTLYGIFNEKQWRIYVALEARTFGPGGQNKVARLARVSRTTIRKGIRELDGGDMYRQGDRIRKTGGGRKSHKKPQQ